MELIDIRQVLTQILGFLALVWILRRYAWAPLLRVLEERRERIAGEFERAEQEKAKGIALQGQYEQELRGIDAQRREKIQEAVAEGKKVAAEIKAQAQVEAQERLMRADAEIAREHEKAKELLKEHIVELSIRTAEKILRQKMDDATHRKLVGEFVDEVGAAR